jgi:phage/plasmid-associated DNA primase
LADGDATVYNYLVDWCAYTIQHPERQAGAAIVFRGKKRVGKGIFANWLVELWGNHGVMVNNGKHLTGQFNGHLEQTCLLFLDEALYAGDKKHESMLKSLITEPNLMIERKHHDAIPSANRLKIVMATNDDWSVPTSGDDARFCVCDVSDLHKGDDSYFTALRAQMATQEAQSAFLADMLARDISKFHPGHVPKTKALTDQIEYSLSPLWKWWMDCLESEHNNGNAWDGEIKSSDLYDAYVSWLDLMKMGAYDRLTQTGFSREFKRAYTKKRRMDGFYWSIGQLIDARQAFRMEIIGERPEKDDDEKIDGVPF